jgi:signal transduction histidine kinase/ligand-binding sensor domain-containing protein
LPVFPSVGGSVHAIQEDALSQLWFGTQRGIFVCESTNLNSFHRIEAVGNIPINALSPGQGGSMWMGSAEGLLHYSSSGQLNVYTHYHGLKDDRVQSLFRDSQGTLWIGTAMGLNRLFNGNVIAESGIPTLENISINGFMEDTESNFWIVSAAGLHCLNDAVFTTFSAKNGAPDEEIGAIAERKPGIMLFGTTKSGLFEGSNKGIAPFEHRPSSLTITALLVDRAKRVWVGSRRKGLDLFENERAINYNTEHGLLDNTILALFEDTRNRLWIGTGKGLNCKINERFLSVPLGSGSNSPSVRVVAEMRDGAIWVGTGDGLHTLTPDRTNHFSKSDGLPDKLVYCLQQDSQGRIWAGTGNGIACFFDNRWHVLANPDRRIRHHVFWMANDDLGYLWYSSQAGIFRASTGDMLHHFADPTATVQRRLFTQSDGLLSTECLGGHQSDGCRSSDGRLWFPTRKGLAIADPKRMPINRVEPPVHLQEILADGHPLALQDDMRLPAGTRLVEFRYAALSLKAMEKVLYRRRLEGIDAGWGDPDNRRTAAYANLAPGSYRFQVMACNNDGLWNKTGASLSFRILPYFYQTVWFYGICVISLTLAALGWHSWRVRHLSRQKQALQTLVQERTRELENQMLQKLKLEEQLQHSRKLEAVGQLASGVAHYFNNLLAIIQGNACLLQENADKETAENLNDITEASQRGAKLVRQLMAFARRHGLRFEPLDINRLLAEHLDSLAKIVGTTIELRREFTPNLPPIKADSTMLAQAVSSLTANALDAMPGGGTLILRTTHVEFSQAQAQRHPEAVAGQFVMLTVTDSGKGMPPEVLNRMFEPFFTTKDIGEGTGLGLAAVYGIIKQHNGWIESESTPGQGTTVRVLLPVEPANGNDGKNC